MGEDVTLPPVPESVAAARRWAVRAVAPMAGDPAAEVAALLVSELVSNVVLHAGTPCDLSVARTDATVRVAVRDRSERMPRTLAPTATTAMSGRGMVIVAELSDAHGVDPHPGGGKSVWFELRVPAVELR